MLKFFVLGWLFVFFNLNVTAGKLSKEDQEVLNAFWQYASRNRLSELSVAERVPIIGKFFMGKPYKSGTLNVTREELPVINLRELDCVTFVEYTLGLALLERYDSSATEEFVRNIVNLRYRNGEIVDYVSRLHYSSDWLYEMGKRGYLTDVTKSSGGMKYVPDVYFMSKNYEKYPVLAKDTHLICEIKKVETAINKRTYYYIPKDRIAQVTEKIKDGDVILITTSIKGLDTSHLGIALKKGKTTYLMHASSDGGKVVTTGVPLEVYMSGNKGQSGIMIGRVPAKGDHSLIALPD